MIENIDLLKEPPKIGSFYYVPCVLTKVDFYSKKWFEIDGDMCYDWDYGNPIKNTYVYPIINNLHSDMESGQNYKHYHVDYRFIKLNQGLLPKDLDKRYTFAPQSRFNLKEGDVHTGWNTNPKIEYHKLKCIRQENLGIAGDPFQAKYKHKCLKKGRCPHRGGNLNQSVAVNGIITCPLHGLKFWENTGNIIEEHLNKIK